VKITSHHSAINSYLYNVELGNSAEFDSTLQNCDSVWYDSLLLHY